MTAKKRKKKKRDKFGDRAFPNHITERLYYDDDDEEHREDVELDVESDLDINEGDLDGEMRIQAKLQGWYGQLTEEAKYAMKLARHEWYCVSEDLYDTAREEEEEEDLPVSRRLSETALKTRVNTKPAVRTAIREYMERAHNYRLMQGYLDALITRGHNLRSLNKNLREERGMTTD